MGSMRELARIEEMYIYMCISPYILKNNEHNLKATCYISLDLYLEDYKNLAVIYTCILSWLTYIPEQVSPNNAEFGFKKCSWKIVRKS